MTPLNDAGRNRRGRVAVLGSVNLDLVLRVAELPAPGETVLSRSSGSGLGGKGANQAVAAARAGAEVEFLGAVGSDENGTRLIAKLVGQHVGVDRIRQVDGMVSGLAVVVVSAQGENQIVVVSGANECVDAAYAESVHDAIAAADVLLLQGELPTAPEPAAIAAARSAGTRVVVNLAPVRDLGDGLADADPLVVNEIEAGQLIGVDLSAPADVEAAAELLRRTARSVVVTIGARGAVLVTRDKVAHIAAPVVPDVRDTTGAGDALVGVLAAALAQGLGLAEATALGVEAASRSVAVEGASEQYPDFAFDTLREGARA
jgi:ribokinase